MLLSSVILVLQETLEAALLVSILAALAVRQQRRFGWLLAGMAGGLVLAAAYAAQLQAISEAFDYAGQELLNALLQGLVAAFAVVLAFGVGAASSAPGAAGNTAPAYGRVFAACAAAAVALSVGREGSEILIYLAGFLAQDTRVQAVLLGALIGVGIGISVGLLLFYGLLGLPRGAGRLVMPGLLALFAGNMLSQAALELVQADLLGGAATAWDSGGWLPEQSIAGHLLYALVGYEATPAASQVLCYLAGAAAALLAAWAGARRGARDAAR